MKRLFGLLKKSIKLVPWLTRKLQSPVGRDTLSTSIVLGLRLAIQAGTLLIAAKMLGPAGFGAFAGIAALSVLFGTLASFGTHWVLVSAVSKEPARRSGVLDYAIPTTILCGMSLFVICLVLCLVIFRSADIQLSVFLVIAATEILLQPWIVLMASEHLALGRAAHSQILQLAPMVLRLGVAFVIFLLDVSEPLVLYSYGYFLATLIAVLFVAVTLQIKWPSPRTWRIPNYSEVQNAAGFAVLNVTASGPAELDKAIAARLLPLEAAGLYSMGARIIGAVTLPVSAMLLSLLPRLFRDGYEHRERTVQLLRCLFTAVIVYSSLLTTALWFLAPIFERLLGGDFSKLGEMVRLLCFAIPGLALRLAAGSVLMALGSPWMRVMFEVFGLLVLVATSLIFIARFGAGGMPLAWLCAEWAMALLGVALVFLTSSQRGRKPLA